MNSSDTEMTRDNTCCLNSHLHTCCESGQIAIYYLSSFVSYLIIISQLHAYIYIDVIRFIFDDISLMTSNLIQEE